MNPLQYFLFKLSELPLGHRVLALFAAIVATVLLLGYVHVLKQWMVLGDEMRVVQRSLAGNRTPATPMPVRQVHGALRLQVADTAR